MGGGYFRGGDMRHGGYIDPCYCTAETNMILGLLYLREKVRTEHSLDFFRSTHLVDVHCRMSGLC